MVKHIVLLPVYFYRTCISPYLPPTCQYLPTCSDYAIGAVKKHGIFKGGMLALRRLARCHPWSKGAGYDPVPGQAKASCCHHHVESDTDKNKD